MGMLSGIKKAVKKVTSTGSKIAKMSGGGALGLAKKVTPGASKLAGLAKKAVGRFGRGGLGSRLTSKIASAAGKAATPRMMTNPAAGSRSYGDDQRVNGKPRTPEMRAAGATATAAAKAEQARQYGASAAMRGTKGPKENASRIAAGNTAVDAFKKKLGAGARSNTDSSGDTRKWKQ